MRYTPVIKPLVLTGPNGSGRTVMAFKLITEFPKKFARAVSYTTRQKRRNEIDGVHYYFMKRQQIEDMNKKEQFVTFKRDPLNDHYYGTSINEINRIVKYGQSPVLEMNALLFSEFKDKVHCNGIYIKPSSYEALRNRLQRQTILTKQEIQQKMNDGQEQWSFSQKHNLFPSENIIVNDNLNDVYMRLKARLFELY